MNQRIERLERLAELRDKGAMSEDEFHAEKAKLLGECAPTEHSQVNLAPFTVDEGRFDNSNSEMLTSQNYYFQKSRNFVFAVFSILFLAIAIYYGNSHKFAGYNLNAISESGGDDYLAALDENPIHFTSDPSGTASKAMSQLIKSTSYCEISIETPNYFGNNKHFFRLIDGVKLEAESAPVLERPVEEYDAKLGPDRIKLKPLNGASERPAIKLKWIARDKDGILVLTEVSSIVNTQAQMRCR